MLTDWLADGQAWRMLWAQREIVTAATAVKAILTTLDRYWCQIPSGGGTRNARVGVISGEILDCSNIQGMCNHCCVMMTLSCVFLRVGFVCIRSTGPMQGSIKAND